MKNYPKIRLLSYLLRVACYIGMVGVLIGPMIDWVYGGVSIHPLKETRWYFSFTDALYSPIKNAPPVVKVVSFITDLIHNASLLITLFCFSKLFKLYEQHQFFTQAHVHYLKVGGSFLFLGQIFRPFYLFLRKYLWALTDQRMAISLSNLIEFKVLMFSGIIFLFAYIIEGVISIEDDYRLTL